MSNEELLEKLMAEKADLDSKVSRLEKFIRSSKFYDLLLQHRHILFEQYKAMGSYSVALLERIILVRQEMGVFGNEDNRPSEYVSNTEEK